MDSITCVSSLPPLDSPDSSSLSDSINRRSEEEFSNVASSNPKRRAGRKKFRETRHPVYRGIRKRNNGKWVCEVREPNTRARIWLGTFPTPEMAARANDVAAMALRGRSACLNFADSVWRLPVPASNDAKTIRKAAVEAAEAFRPSLQPGADSARGNVNQTNLNSSDAVYVDEEEAVFGMPGLLANMAEGLLLSPPRSAGAECHWDDVESEGDVSLWSYSI